MKHIVIIPDGNRRWAEQNHLSHEQGYIKGLEVFEEIIEHARKLNIPYLTLWALSCENLNRSSVWRAMYFKLIRQYLREKCEKAIQNNIKIIFIGQDIANIDLKLHEMMREMEEKSANNTAMTLIFAFNYTGQTDIMSAVQKIIDQGIKTITKELIESHLMTYPIPAPDLIIRTSGEQRLSNCMLWQAAYSEFVFFEKHWPDFTKEDFNQAIHTFEQRQRRFGT